MQKYETTLHIFRRDLRVQDNTALIQALKNSKKVIPCFILDPRQLKDNEYFSQNAFQFMVESLNDLNQELKKRKAKLYLFNDKPKDLITKLIKEKQIDAIYLNKDYTPFSKKRDEEIEQICKEHNIAFHAFSDALINEPGTVRKNDGNPYTIFTPFFRKAREIPLNPPQKNSFTNYSTTKIKHETTLPKIDPPNKQLKVRGGRTNARKLLSNIKNLKNYKDKRDIPKEDATSHLSAHLKFGTVSIREVLERALTHLGPNNTFISELYWRDFFTHIAHFFPHVFGHAFNKKYAGLKWSTSKAAFKAWCEGKTGFPIVDAGMRQLNTTGYMHNRVRMIVASFLVKDLHIDWRWGEKYFAQKLVDYDPSVNNGNWQWAASTGCDAQPYFRIFNPWRQQERFDPDCAYIKTWVTELKSLTAKEIHKISDNPLKEYPKPIVEHKEASSQAKAMFSALK